MYAYLKHTIFNTQAPPINTDNQSPDRTNSTSVSLPESVRRIQLLEEDLNEKDCEILKLRTEADMNSRKILFLSHYATSIRQESSQSRSSAKRRLSDLTDRERKLYRRVSDECNKLVKEKIDVEQSQSAQLKTKFREVCSELEESNRKIMDEFKSDFLELKGKLFSTIHLPPDS